MGDGGVPQPVGAGLAALYGCSGRTVRDWWLFVEGLQVQRNWGELMGMVVFKLGRRLPRTSTSSGQDGHGT